PVSGKKILEAQKLRRLWPADQHRAAGAGFDQSNATQDQRAHDPLAKVRLGDDQRAQLLGWHEQRLDIIVRMSVNERRTTRQRSALAEKLAMGVRDERNDMTQSVALAQRDAALQDDEHAGPGLACGNQSLAADIVS